MSIVEINEVQMSELNLALEGKAFAKKCRSQLMEGRAIIGNGGVTGCIEVHLCESSHGAVEWHVCIMPERKPEDLARGKHSYPGRLEINHVSTFTDWDPMVKFVKDTVISDYI